jgi:hypothetical protein
MTNTIPPFRHEQIIVPEIYMTDPEGRPLVPATGFDAFRHKRVWAVYRVQAGRSSAETHSSDFVGIAIAKAYADDLNRNLGIDEAHYFKVYRLADAFLSANPPSQTPVYSPTINC